jgi:copper resistance protein B
MRWVSALLAVVAFPAWAQHAHHEHPPATAPAKPVPTDAATPASSASSPLSFPEPTAAERAAAFPADLENMDMRAHMDDNPLVAVLRADQLEWRDDDSLGWNVRAAIGRNFDKLLLRSEGERADGDTEHADAELLWSHATGPWWDRVLGIRHDVGNGGPSRTWAALGVQGLAPYMFELEATAYVGESGRLAARFEGEYELLLTNRLILQPKLEADLYSRRSRKRHRQRPQRGRIRPAAALRSQPAVRAIFRPRVVAQVRAHGALRRG